jgi:hypothetical protein
MGRRGEIEDSGKGVKERMGRENQIVLIVECAMWTLVGVNGIEKIFQV